jgi:hypothetical protein
MAMKQHATTEELLEAVFSVACATIIAMQWHAKHTSTTIEELCFLCSPCLDVTTGTVWGN